MKRTLIALTTLLAFNAANAADEVSLMHGKLNFSSTPFGPHTTYLDLGVEVKDISYEKDFIIHYSVDGGPWQMFATDDPNTSEDENNWARVRYQGVTVPGKQAFAITVSTESAASSVEYAVEYVLNGDFSNSFSDNNGGSNYNVVTGYANFGTWWKVVQDHGTYGLYAGETSWTFGTFTGADHKIYSEDMGTLGQVYVRYTTDDWATWAEHTATYVETANGVHVWSFDLGAIDNSVETVEWAIRYNVNGTDYWDNNLTKNYSVNKPR